MKNKTHVIKLLGDNRSDAPYRGAFGDMPGATVEGGSWLMPLTELQDPELALVTHSQSADPDHTRFTVRFTSLVSLRAFFLGYTNASIYASVRLTGYDDEARTAVSFRKEFDAYPAYAYTGDLDWRAENWWSGKPTPSQLEGFTQNAFCVFDDEEYARLIDVEIVDPGNMHRFFRAGRLLCLNGWQPTTNYVLGGALALESDTTIEKTMSGAEVFDVREPARIYNIGFQNLREQEALDRGFEMVRKAAIHRAGGEILVVDDFAPINLHRLSFLAWPRPLTAFERAQPKRANLTFQLKERLP